MQSSYWEHELWNRQTETCLAHNVRCWLGTNKLTQLLDNPGLSTLRELPRVTYYSFPLLPPFPLLAFALASSPGEESDQGWEEGTAEDPLVPGMEELCLLSPQPPRLLHAQTRGTAVWAHWCWDGSAPAACFQRILISCQSQSIREKETSIIHKTSQAQLYFHSVASWLHSGTCTFLQPIQTCLVNPSVSSVSSHFPPYCPSVTVWRKMILQSERKILPQKLKKKMLSVWNQVKTFLLHLFSCFSPPLYNLLWKFWS